MLTGTHTRTHAPHAPDAGTPPHQSHFGSVLVAIRRVLCKSVQTARYSTYKRSMVAHCTKYSYTILSTTACCSAPLAPSYRRRRAERKPNLASPLAPEPAKRTGEGDRPAHTRLSGGRRPPFPA